jgi:uracil-DNA glycosylase
MFRGKMPCDVLFVGEAPGESENVSRIPFDGQAGRLLDDIIRRGITLDYPTYRVGICNLVGCIPRIDPDEDDNGRAGRKAGEPEDHQIKACGPRLIELVRLANPQLIVCVGKLAKDWLTVGMKSSIDVDRNIPRVHIVHPSWILSKCPPQMKQLKIQECVVTINNAVEELVCPF